MSRNWNGSTTAWRALRAQVLAENRVTNQGRCTLLLPGCTGEADTAHHTLGRGVTGDNPKYIQAVCGHCNLKAGEPGRNHVPHTTVSTW